MIAPLTRAARHGLTLLELLVVIAIVTILIGLLLPAVQKVRESAARARCSNNFHQLALAAHAYHDANNRLPPGQVGPLTKVPGQPYYGWDPDSTAWSWLARVLPFVEQSSLHDRGGVPRQSLRASGIVGYSVSLFLCPSAGNRLTRSDAGNLPGLEVAVTCYKGVSGANWGFDTWENRMVDTYWPNPSAAGSYDGLSFPDGTMFRSDITRPLRLDHIADGTSQTFLIGEDVPALNRWASWAYAANAYGTCAIPPNATAPDGKSFLTDNWGNTWAFRSNHSRGTQFALADGSARFVRSDVRLSAYRAMATIRGGEIVGDE